MSDFNALHQFLLLVVAGITVAYVLASMLFRGKEPSFHRVVVTSVLATILVHGYLLVFGEGTDQFLLISVVVMLAYGFIGGLVLDWLRTRFRKPPGDTTP